MEVPHSRCCGIDIHKRSITVCVLIRETGRKEHAVMIISARPLETAWGERRKKFILSDLARLTDEYALRYAGMAIGR
jgi:hypothetical protein